MTLPPSMFGRDFMSNFSPLQSLVSRAVDPYKHEPDYAAHLEVAEYINNKKANTPREAAMMIVRIVNNRNPHVSILALALLETLVQSCGYPFHLQVSTKEFLNELVRRFPERPPPFPGPVMSKILDLIHTWKETICTDSRWRDDLGNIRDMHRLLTFKGYRFREMSRPQPAVASTSSLKSAEELEEEDREAQSAKLQELIRRGTPRDLAAAQELMKTLAGAEPDKKPDYRSQSLTELNKLEQKVILLNEMLDNVDTQRGERFAPGDVYDQVSSILTSARPKIQKWISDAETNDPEMLDIFLQMNDQMNSVLNRYESFKKGDFVAAANPVPSEYAASSKANDLSLIDLEDPTPTSTNTGGAADDLAGLFNTPQSMTTSPPLINSTQASMSFNSRPQHSLGLFSTSPQSTGSGSSASSSPFGSIMLPGTPQPRDQARMGSPVGMGHSQTNLMGMAGGGGIGGSGSLGGPGSSFSKGGTSGLPGFGAGPNQTMGGMNQSQSSSWGMGAQVTPGNMPMNNSMPGTIPSQQHQQPPQQAQRKDPFADLAGLF